MRVEIDLPFDHCRQRGNRQLDFLRHDLPHLLAVLFLESDLRFLRWMRLVGLVVAQVKYFVVCVFWHLQSSKRARYELASALTNSSHRNPDPGFGSSGWIAPVSG